MICGSTEEEICSVVKRGSDHIESAAIRRKWCRGAYYPNGFWGLIWLRKGKFAAGLRERVKGIDIRGII